MIIHEFDDIEIEKLNSNNISMLPRFMYYCQQLGYQNNSSELALKLNSMNPPNGQYWVTIKEDQEITGISGVHYFPEIGLKSWRVLFRLAVIPSMNKTHFSKNPILASIHFNKVLPLQLSFARDRGGEEFYITTPTNDITDKSNKDFKLDRIVMPYMERLGLVSNYAKGIDLFHSKQDVWRLNTEKYYEYNMVSNARFFNNR